MAVAHNQAQPDEPRSDVLNDGITHFRSKVSQSARFLCTAESGHPFGVESRPADRNVTQHGVANDSPKRTKLERVRDWLNGQLENRVDLFRACVGKPLELRGRLDAV